MRAAVCPALGPPEVVEVREVDEPRLEPGSVRVRVGAAAVNFPDVLLIAGRYQIPVEPPFVPGSEFAGTVLETAPGVDAIGTGDRVFGTTFVGAFAEQVVVPVSSLTAVPASVDLAAAAAFGVAHRTAYHSLHSVAALRPGEELVVLGAGGGVGLAAVQLGAAAGARVTAVASSPDKLDAARACGAAEGVNHRDGDLRGALKRVLPAGADVVVDPVGGALSEPALRSLHWSGRFVTVGYAAGSIPRIPLNLVLLKGISIVGFELRGFGVHHPDVMAEGESALLAMLADGRATPYIGARFGLTEVAGALRYVADGRAVGKVVIDFP